MSAQFTQEQRAIYLRIRKSVIGGLKMTFNDHPEYRDCPLNDMNYRELVEGAAKRIANDLVNGHNLAFLKKQLIKGSLFRDKPNTRVFK